MITHTIESYWIPSQKKTKSKLQIKKIRQNFKFWNGHYPRHTFLSCLIRCANMKWIRWVLLKIQNGHDSVHRRTDGQGDTSIPPYQLRWSGGYNYHWHRAGLHISRIIHMVHAVLCFVVVRYRLILPIFIRIPSLALGQSYDCPSASEVTLMNMV